MSHTVESIQETLNNDYQELGTWQAVADKYGLKRGTVHSIAKRGNIPKSKSVRAKLGIRNEVQRFPVWYATKEEQLKARERRDRDRGK
jgi:hypothetical protein